MKKNIIISKVLQSIFNIWLKWCMFICIILIMCIILGFSLYANDYNFIRALGLGVFFHVYIPMLPCIGGSMWFMEWFFIIILVNQIILSLPIIEDKEQFKKYYFLLMVVIFLWILNNRYFLGISSYFVFYSIFFMMGTIHQRIKLNKCYKLIVFLMLVLFFTYLSNYLCDANLLNMQSAKFPPSPKYMFYSLITIGVAIYLKRYNLSNKLIEKIGKNALWFYFAQGVSSSLLYYIIKYIPIDVWFAKWLVMLVINIIVAVIIAECFRMIWKSIFNSCLRISMKKAEK